MEDIDVIRTINSISKSIQMEKIPISEFISRRLRLLLSKQIWTSSDRHEMLDMLSLLLLEDNLTLIIAENFSPLLLELFSHAVTSPVKENTDFTRHELIGVALAKLVGRYPVASQFCTQYFEVHPSILECLIHDGEPYCKKERKDKSLEDGHLKKLLEASFQLLVHNCHFFYKRWNWAPLIDLIGHKEADVRWLTCHCIAIVTGMSSIYQHSFLMQHFSKKEMLDLRIKYTDMLQPTMKIQNMALHLERQEASQIKTHCMGHFVKTDLCENVVSVSGVLIDSIKSNKKIEQSKSMVLVPSIRSALRSLALAVASGDCILLQGPVGCGKTALVEHLAAETGRIGPPYLIKVQLGDQMDSKLLLGSHCCTDIPGEFIWHAGPLTQAMINGYWLLLEDINYAPMDIISLLIPVLHSKSITLPGHAEPVKAAAGFRLFATQRLFASHEGLQSEFRSHADMLLKLWRKVAIEPMSRSELEEVIITKWPILKPLSCRILDIYFMLSSGGHQSENQSIAAIKPLSKGRLISTRDLLKWCQRISVDFDIKSVERAVVIFQDALDCFCRSIPFSDHRLSVAKCIGTELNLTNAKVEHYFEKHKPDITVMNEIVKVGRAILMRNQEESSILQRNQMTFAHTRQALSLLESVAVAVKNQEPILLVGETGTGKTSIVQYLATLLGYKLTVINMNQQSDSVDLLGGYKPVELKTLLTPLHEEFEEIFGCTFSHAQNIKFLGHIMRCFTTQNWQDLFKLMIHTQKVATKKLESRSKNNDKELSLLHRWKKLGIKIHKLQTKVKQIENTLAFSFIEGSLVKAIREGEWILLDEINLAEAETLECLGGLLESSAGSVILAERGDREPVIRHPNFCLFACMNPATDIGKKDLPSGIRNRFTEFFIEELEDKTDLLILVDTFLRGLSLPSEILKRIVQFYVHIRKNASTVFSDGTGHHPHYSLRTLCRALSFAARNSCGSVPRSLFEAFSLSFLTQLDRNSHPLVTKQIAKYLLEKNQISVLKQPLPEPVKGKYICFEGYWIPQGPKAPIISEKYILTPSVRQNLKDLVRVVSAGKQPVLLQGETSVGKTSLVQWLAAASGNHCVRVNNHEHTDLQEYLGSYCADVDGKLTFKEGILVEAMLQGHWIILDELNLAPTDILEALNRVLDDNRELYIPEVQRTIKAHPQFMLFATQNPPGVYGGRKMLSRAFRNRFVELHFDEIPPAELETILFQRCDVPPSYCKKLVDIMLELQIQRRESGIFAGKKGYITLRDLFRWGERYRLASQQTKKFYDWNEHLANEGYILLAGRVRKPEEADVIQKVIEKHMKCKLYPQQLLSTGKGLNSVVANILETLPTESLPKEFQHIVWTYNMKRMTLLVGQAMKFNEPVLLIGDTGCGKTTICELFATLSGKKLFSVNCHMHSESSDFLGGLRPVRHIQRQMEKPKLFEWVDGPLVTSMKLGALFLADEISLADDSVLERLNSILETERNVLLAEKSGSSNNYEETIVTAEEGFQFLATMNPGGDFGKKELSPALRNRFTEIWCPSLTDKEDMINIIKHNIRSEVITEEIKNYFSRAMVEFLDWFTSEINPRCTTSIRDLLAWVNFVNHTTSQEYCNFPLNLSDAYIHGACLVYLDSLGSGMTSFNDIEDVKEARKNGMNYLVTQMKPVFDSLSHSLDVANIYKDSFGIVYDKHYFGIHPFYVTIGPHSDCSLEGSYTLASPTPHANALRLLRAMQVSKPILLEGVPGVGKTSLVISLAKASGNKVIRINLSEQTDISDLFGADLPVEGKCGEFAWRDGPLIQALKSGCWVLLDELNLASQSVLEGLNACLDHRGEIFVPELGKSFQIDRQMTWIFGCQNPHKQGGARKGLPKSFLNRFTQVYIDPMSSEDLIFISHVMFPLIPEEIMSKMVEFNEKLADAILIQRLWGQKGSPWEFNLRDIFRWCDVLLHNQENNHLNPGQYVELIYADRMRNTIDKAQVVQLYNKTFPFHPLPLNQAPLQLMVTEQYVQVGYSFLNRQGSFPNANQLVPLHYQLKPLQSLMKCIEMKWMAILVGSSVGKTSLVNLLATLTGHPLLILSVSSEMDTTELLGGFEQADLTHHLDHVNQQVEIILKNAVWSILLLEEESNAQASFILERWFLYQQLQAQPLSSELNEELKCFQKKIDGLTAIIECLNSVLLSDELIQELVLAKEELKRIEYLLKSVGVISSGGRFEWVDSSLVTAVKKGYWLLIDDVNFCSPSVLDRLNGLLEPNGVLCLSEKGIAGEEIPIIKPHPNFRLILTMDPKNGEISRAMRNRGVEIYIPGQDDGCELMYLDNCRLIQSKGLHDPLIIDRFLKIQKRICEESKGNEKTGLLDLLHAACLYKQTNQCGSFPKNALWESCHNVYASNILSYSKKREIEYILQMEIEKFPDIQNKNGTFITSISSLMPCTLDFQMDPELANLKQDIILFHCLLHDVINSDKVQDSNSCQDTIPFIATLPISFSTLKPSQRMYLMTTIVQLFMETSTTSDWELRENLMCKLTLNYLNQNNKDSLRDINSCLNEFVKFLSNIPSLPVIQQLTSYVKKLASYKGSVGSYINGDKTLLDLRWNPLLMKKLLISGKGPYPNDVLIEMESAANRFHLLLKYYSLKFMENMSSLKQVTNEKQISFLELARKYNENHIMINDLPHRVIQHLLSFFYALNEEVNSLLGEQNFICHTEAVSKFLEIIQYCHYFSEISNQLYEKHSVQHHLSLFSLHWTWMEKKVFPLLCQYQKLNSKEKSSLVIIISAIKQDMAISVCNIHKLRLKLTKHLGYSSYLQTSEAAMIFLEVQRLTAVLDARKYIDDNCCFNELLHLYTLAPFCIEWLSSVLQALHNASSNQILTKARENVQSIKETMIQKGLIKDTEVVAELICQSKQDNIKLQQLACHIQLLPMIDYLYVLNKIEVLYSMMKITACKLIPKYSLKQENFDEHIAYKLQFLSKIGKQNILNPTSYLNEFANSENLNGNNMIRSFMNFFIHVQQSPSAANITHYLTWKPKKSLKEETKDGQPFPDNEDTSPLWQQNDLWSQQMPLRTFICMILQGNLKSVSFTLGNFFEKSKQLSMVNEILWRNVFTFSSNGNSFRYISANIVQLWFSSILWCLLSVSSDEINVINPNEDLYQLASHIELPTEILNIFTKAVSSVNALEDAMTCEFNESLHWMLGKAWAYVGLFTMQLFAPRDIIDPVEKWKVKLQYCLSELENLTMEINLRNMQYEIITGHPLSLTNECHPLIKDRINKQHKIEEKMAKLRSRIVYRPTDSQFQNLRNDVQHYLVSIGSPAKVCNFISKLESYKVSQMNESEEVLNSIDNLLQEISKWGSSQSSFVDKMQKKYLLYDDLITPFITGIKQMSFGIQTAKHYISSSRFKSHINRKNFLVVENLIIDLIKFPFINMESVKESSSLPHFISKSGTLSLMENVLNIASDKKAILVSQNIFKLVMSALLELRNETLVSSGIFTQKIFRVMTDLLQFLANTWHQQETNQKEKEQEDECLYRYHEKREIKEEKQDKMNVAELFPTYEKDFQDLCHSSADISIEEHPLSKSSLDAGFNHVFEQQDMIAIWCIHTSIMTRLSNGAMSPFICRLHSFGDFDSVDTDYISSFMLRHEVAQYLMETIGYNLDSMLDYHTVGSTLLANYAILKSCHVSTNQVGKPVYDIYHIPNPSEAIRCYLPLENLTNKVHLLLDQFPEHPSLKRILVISDRIMNFPINSPLMKFLTGLEIVLSVSQDWEVNSHKGASLINELASITELIIQWRKLELRCWSECLNSVFNKQYLDCAKWWLHLYQLIIPLIGQNLKGDDKWKKDVTQKLPETLSAFFEHSTLGEFKACLDLLYVFLEHTKYSVEFFDQTHVFSILYNIYQFYQQFLQSVDDNISLEKKSIEKEVKDYVKITQWNDINFWSLKQSVEKSHHVIYKHMKQFEKILKQPARTHLILEEKSEAEHGNSWEFKCVLNEFVSPLSLQENIKEMITSKGSILTKQKYKKMRHLCKNIFQNSLILKQINYLNEFAGNIASAANELRLLDISKGADAERRKKEVRHVHMRKQKALSDLFKELAASGLSYKLGLILWKELSAENIMTSPPIDVNELVTRSCLSRMSDCLWKSCQDGILKYFYKSVAKHNMMSLCLESPSKELNPNNIEKCKGFIGHLMHLVIHQRHSLFSNSCSLFKIRNLLFNMQALIKFRNSEVEMFLPPQNYLEKWMVNIHQLSVQITTGIEQFILILECCPEQKDDAPFLSEPLIDLPSLVIANKGSTLWNELFAKAKIILELIKSVIQQLPRKSSNVMWFYEDYITIVSTFEQLSVIAEHVRLLKTYAGSDSKQNCLTESLSFILKEIDSQKSTFEAEVSNLQLKRKQCVQSDMQKLFIRKLTLAVEKLSKQFLLATQREYLNSTKIEATLKMTDNYGIVDKYLTDGIINEFSVSLENMCLAKVEKLSTKIETLMKMINSMEFQVDTTCHIISTALPFVDQYVNLMQFLVINQTASHRALCKLLYILLNIFTELAQKGFCLPEELQQEVIEKEGTVQFKDIEDGGLGDGEGRKDVSEKLESEDQLDEALKPEDYNKEKEDALEPDIQEEEQGIEMSDNFDGKLHDPKINENISEKSSDDEEDNLDKQMGDVNEDGEKLNNELWGSDDESDEEEMKNDDSDQGKPQSNSTLVAKTDSKEKGENDEKEHDDNDKNETKLPELEDIEEYGGEHLNKPDSAEEAKDTPDLPEDFQLDKDEENAEDTHDENMQEDPTIEESNADEEMEEKEQIEIDEKNKSNVDEIKEQEINKEVDQECNDDSKEKTSEENEMEEARVPSRDNTAVNEALPSDNVSKTYSKDTIQTEDMMEEFGGMTEQSDNKHEQHGQGLASCNTHVETETHESDTVSSISTNMKEPENNKHQQKQQLKDSCDERTLGSFDTDILQVETMESSEMETELSNLPLKSDIYEHVKNPDYTYDTQVADIATEQQVREQKPFDIDRKSEGTEEIEDKNVKNVATAKCFPAAAEKQNSLGLKEVQEEMEIDKVSSDSTSIPPLTISASRGPNSSIHTQCEYLQPLSKYDLPKHLEHNIKFASSTELVEKLWQEHTAAVTPLVQELCEQLRLVLEPTKMSKLKGDYRTGKRLNMRKVIPYIASQFRKDKIWLRRTKPSKREYQIVLAVDDSFSMADNKSKQLAFQSLALLGKSLSLLEAGEISIMKFGEDVCLLHPFGEPFTDQSGARVLQEFTFAQGRTCIMQLLNSAANMMIESQCGIVSKHVSPETAQLLIIISDGRGIFNEGEASVKHAVQYVRNNNIFLVFVILDNPENKDSILDIQVPIFKAPDIIEIHSYMAKFPFPFYIILRDINSMPLVLGEALRQWFELITSTEH